ncbi:methylenetetrahydrofolate reductase [Yersinia pseudotuberculosis]|uniref:methylenetetrahydrofolate reductase n=1 Tax=Yersinia pseudotuberculosis TaxID=633 RepID=UPI00061C1671|nr:methylenetetrahydrofolate reductase [Yersinia pseudotuberculosis]CNK81997.1 methylenetetrahydrofolate reductase [Yersinia pseudotuberculosis]
MKRKLSFEMNSAKNEKEMENIFKLIEFTDTLDPIYYTVNTEIGSSVWSDTYRTVIELREKTDVPLIPHITINNKKEREIMQIIEKYINVGICEFFVIRGDKHVYDQDNPINYGVELIELIRRSHKHIGIKTSLYPDFHKETTEVKEEIDWNERKYQLGVNEFISQLTLNTNALDFLSHWVDKERPFTPSIMPLGNFSFIEKFTSSNSIDYPLWIKKFANSKSNSNEDKENIGIEIIRFLCREYLNQRERLHIFTLNKVDVMKKIFQ